MSPANIPVDNNINDLDHLLAMHLAEDLNGSSHSNDHRNHRDNVFDGQLLSSNFD